MSLAFLTVATGRYLAYAQANLLSLWTHRLQAEIVVWTDRPGDMAGDGITSHPWPALGWPFATLLRYEAYLNAPELRGPDAPQYLYAMDADLVWSRDPWPDLCGRSLVFAAHPGFSGAHAKDAPFAQAGLCALHEGVQPPYLAGGFWGGRRERFLGVCEAVRDLIRREASSERVPKWHDETALNRVAVDQPDRHVLPWGWLAPDAACEWYLGDRAQACVLAVTKPKEAR